VIRKICRMAAIEFILATGFALLPFSHVNASATLHTATLWLQATDSCKEGLPGASFSLVNASGQAFADPVTNCRYVP
jgi:hypothetical protein